MDINIIFVECRCREEIIRQRLKKRTTDHDVSDARLKHLDAFKIRYEALDEISDENLIAIDTEMPLKENMTDILARVDMPVIYPP
jgi:predicted kinase